MFISFKRKTKFKEGPGLQSGQYKVGVSILMADFISADFYLSADFQNGQKLPGILPTNNALF